MNPKVVSKTKNSTKIMFARLFLQSIMTMKKTNVRTNSDHEESRRRSLIIDTAAYLSMARVVGWKRTWSRSIIFKIRNRAIRKKGSVKKKRRRRVGRIHQKNRLFKIEKLRKPVPGGEAMDVCGLLDETVHYTKSLSTQVKEMQTIANNLSKYTYNTSMLSFLSII
ncbi:putative transcription factor [Tripterygium wilfordii]|uniref:Putative transcription factor n=1 Tax=Tripterygium wilfordii TaxID=458696 RepID=A0A7J7D8L9_TRIWF|nr:transcription factor IBH1-like [Tripterygium wilfordii]KAF5742715.1 putative transcription factor [Tripterygium wilfordii]